MNEEERKYWLTLTMQHWEPRLRRYCGRFVRAEVAAEIAQECFTRLWNDPENLKGREQAWLFRVGRNLCIDHLRKEKRVTLKEVEGVAVPSAEPGLEHHEQSTELQKLTNALPPAQREVIRLKFQEGMSYQQIAEVTGHSVSYVGVLIHLALGEIRKQLAKSGGAR